MTARTALSAIVALALSALLAALLALALWASAAQQAQMQAQRDAHLLGNLRTLAENSLATGLQPEQLEMLQAMIEREHQAFSDILAIDVFSPQGLVLYSSDGGARGSQVPSDWRALLTATGSWQRQAPGLRRIGARFDNDLGEAAGGIVVTLGHSSAPASLAQWVSRAQQGLLALVIAIAALAGAVLGLRAAFARLMRPYAQAAQTLQGQGPESARSRSALPSIPLLQQAAQAYYGAQQQALQRWRSAWAQLDALDQGQGQGISNPVSIAAAPTAPAAPAAKLDTAAIAALPDWRWRSGALTGAVVLIIGALCALWVLGHIQSQGARTAREDARAIAQSVAQTLAQQLARAVRVGIPLPDLPGVPQYLQAHLSGQNMLHSIAITTGQNSAQGAAQGAPLYQVGPDLPPTQPPDNPTAAHSEGTLWATAPIEAASAIAPASTSANTSTPSPVARVWVAAQARQALRGVQERAQWTALLLVLALALAAGLAAALGPGARLQALQSRMAAGLWGQPGRASTLDTAPGDGADGDGLQQLMAAMADSDEALQAARAQAQALAQELQSVDFDGHLRPPIAHILQAADIACDLACDLGSDIASTPAAPTPPPPSPP